jgi:hypothetical protein
MRIISNFHDYYDVIQGMGIDKECVYIRKTQEIPLVLTPKNYRFYDEGHDIGNRHYSWRIRQSLFNEVLLSASYLLVGFCGKLYPIVVYETSDLKPVIHLFYKNNFKKGDIQKLLGIVPSKYTWDHAEEERVVNFLNSDYSKYQSLFTTYKVPIFVAGEISKVSNEPVVILNSNLSHINFYKIKDSYTAYQEIYQYISGVLGINSNEMIELKDKDKIIKQGFDLKYGFRTRPKEKKK